MFVSFPLVSFRVVFPFPPSCLSSFLFFQPSFFLIFSTGKWRVRLAMAYPWSARARVEYNGQITLHFKDSTAHGIINAAPSAPSLINNHAEVGDSEISNNNNNNNNNNNRRRRHANPPEVAHDGNTGNGNSHNNDSGDNVISTHSYFLWTVATWFFVSGSLGNPPLPPLPLPPPCWLESYPPCYLES